MASSVDVSQNTRKRLRAARACELCRSKKYRCDEEAPCSRCRRWNVACVYNDGGRVRQRHRSLDQQDHQGNQVNQENHGTYTEASRTADHENSVAHNLSGPLTDEVFTNTGQHPSLLDRNDDSDTNHSDGVNDVNVHTINAEFHGPTSSLAFLATLPQNDHEDQDSLVPPSNRIQDSAVQSLVSALHNDSFSPDARGHKAAESELLRNERFYFRQSQPFLEGYFQNLHYIHPILDRQAFLSACEMLWFGRDEKFDPSFVCLYYAVMSLGALTREWDEKLLDGMGRFEWSRKMFQLSALAMGPFPGRNDLQSVQANIIMAKVCQNELNPSLAYMYLGQAVRTSLAAGYNRLVASRPGKDVQSNAAAISKTWWGLFSLEIEMSFALGRPDSLGLDAYHTQIMPAIEIGDTAILTCMVDLARIIRKVSTLLYLSNTSIDTKVAAAEKVEQELNAWIQALPEIIRPRTIADREESINILPMTPKWAIRQRHTLKFRYHNVLMVLYRPFLLASARRDNELAKNHEDEVLKCVSAARETIEVMHYMFCNCSYFRTWWYNTTYTLYAAAIIQLYATRIAQPQEQPGLLRLLRLATDILKAMQDNVVARKAAKLLQRAYARLQKPDLDTETAPSRQSIIRESQEGLLDTQITILGNISPEDSWNQEQIDMMTQLFPFSDTSLLTWADADFEAIING